MNQVTKSFPLKCGAVIGLASLSFPLFQTVAEARDGTFQGDVVQTSYGPVQVQITIAGGKITSAAALASPSGASQRYSDVAIPALVRETLVAQSANIQGVSGVSYTSQGWYNSLASAIAKSGLVTTSVPTVSPSPTPSPVAGSGTGNQETKDSLGRLMDSIVSASVIFAKLSSQVATANAQVAGVRKELGAITNVSSTSDLALREAGAVNMVASIAESFNSTSQQIADFNSSYQNLVNSVAKDKALGNYDVSEIDALNNVDAALSATTARFSDTKKSLSLLVDAANTMDVLFKAKLATQSVSQPLPTQVPSSSAPSSVDAAIEATDAANAATDAANGAMDSADAATSAIMDAGDAKDLAFTAVTDAAQSGLKTFAQTRVDSAIALTQAAINKLNAQKLAFDSTKYNLGNLDGVVIGISKAISVTQSRIAVDQAALAASSDDRSKKGWASAVESWKKFVTSLTTMQTKNSNSLAQMQSALQALSGLNQKLNQPSPISTSSPLSNTTSPENNQSTSDSTIPDLAPDVTNANVISVALINSKKSRVDIDSEFSKKQLLVVATKKGIKKKLTYKVTTKIDGSASFTTAVNLNGYTVILYNGTEELDRTIGGN